MTGTPASTSSVLARALAQGRTWLRAPVAALLAPQAVVLDPGTAAPTVRALPASDAALEVQFETAVDTLLQMLDAAALGQRRLHVVVSDFWARPLVLPMAGPSPTEAEVEIVLATQYRRNYGSLMQAWQWCWARHGAQLVAVAWPAVGLQRLRDGLAASGHVLATARPLAVDAVLGARQAAGNGWVGVVERDAFSLLRRTPAGWQSWSVGVCGPDLARSLPLQLQREASRQGDDCRVLDLLDLDGGNGLGMVRQALVETGWTVPAHSGYLAPGKLSRRLCQQIAARGTA